MLLIDSDSIFSRLSSAPGPIVLYGAGFFARLALFAIRKHGYDVSYICDSDPTKHGTKFCGYTVQSAQQLNMIKHTAHVFVTSIYILPIESSLTMDGVQNIYACKAFFESVDYANADLDLGDIPETRAYGQSRDIVNIQRQIQLYSNECLKRNISEHAGLDLKYVDFVVTEACSMKCICLLYTSDAADE